ncbi:DER1-domain-containing protein [Gautieria morchelliformis]|nr:DER1-domain-containing protein [Gautieria morchelliformis]
MDTTAFMAEIRKIPPVTRFLAGSSLAVTLPVMLQLVSVYKVIYHYSLVFERLEVWRIWTAFFFGGSGINFLFDFIMLYRTSDALESQHYTRRSADYAWQLMLASVGLLGLNHPLGSHLLHRPLILTLVYLSSRLSPHTPFSLFGLVTIPAMWWPYVMLGLDGMMGGTQMLVQSLTGVVVGHAWWLLIWRDTAGFSGRAPEWLKRLMPPPPAPAGASGPQPRGFGATRGAATAAPARQPAGYQWGTGQRLGDR